MTVDEYADKLVRDFILNITDHVFSNIQHDENLMREYQTNVHRSHLEVVNMAIGKKVKELLHLENDGICDKPKSWLIKEYTLHKIKE
jgi:hypothetical protein